MIGRTLDAVLSVVQMIGRETGGSDSVLIGLAGAIRKVVLPVEPMWYNKKPG